MANRYFQQFFHSFTKNLTGLHGIISINSSAAVTGETINGATVAKTGTGEYTITLDDKYPAIEACELQLEAATAVDLVPQVVSTDVVGAKTIVFKLLAGSTATNPSAACKVHVALRLRNSSVA